MSLSHKNNNIFSSVGTEDAQLTPNINNNINDVSQLKGGGFIGSLFGSSNQKYLTKLIIDALEQSNHVAANFLVKYPFFVDLEYKNNSCDNLIHLLCRHSHNAPNVKHVLLKIITKYDVKSLLNAQNKFGDTPLHCAVASGCHDMVDVMIKNGAKRIENNEGFIIDTEQPPTKDIDHSKNIFSKNPDLDDDDGSFFTLDNDNMKGEVNWLNDLFMTNASSQLPFSVMSDGTDIYTKSRYNNNDNDGEHGVDDIPNVSIISLLHNNDNNNDVERSPNLTQYINIDGLSSHNLSNYDGVNNVDNIDSANSMHNSDNSERIYRELVNELRGQSMLGGGNGAKLNIYTGQRHFDFSIDTVNDSSIFGTSIDSQDSHDKNNGSTGGVVSDDLTDDTTLLSNVVNRNKNLKSMLHNEAVKKINTIINSLQKISDNDKKKVNKLMDDVEMDNIVIKHKYIARAVKAIMYGTIKEKHKELTGIDKIHHLLNEINDKSVLKILLDKQKDILAIIKVMKDKDDAFNTKKDKIKKIKKDIVANKLNRNVFGESNRSSEYQFNNISSPEYETYGQTDTDTYTNNSYGQTSNNTDTNTSITAETDTDTDTETD